MTSILNKYKCRVVKYILYNKNSVTHQTILVKAMARKREMKENEESSSKDDKQDDDKAKEERIERMREKIVSLL